VQGATGAVRAPSHGVDSKRIGADEMTNLTEIATALWIAEGAIVNFYGFAYPTRSTIIRLVNGDLWVWSPIALTADLKSEIDKLGPVTHLVSPNKLHHLYLQDWSTAYPHAKLWGPASTIRKRPDLLFQPPLVNEAPSDWRDQIRQAWFRGSFLLDEIEFFHPSSAEHVNGFETRRAKSLVSKGCCFLG
jgi:hypothetical protein